MKNILITGVFLCAFCIAGAQSIHTIVLQPGPEPGKDAYINSAYPFFNQNFGNTTSLIASAYTYEGLFGIGRSLLSFDLSIIPADAEILEAKLSLYFDPDNGHGFQTGDNACYIKRITSPWDEQAVTWIDQPTYSDSNEVFLPPSVSAVQDYPDIDVTSLVKDMIEYPDQSFGFSIHMIVEEVYRSLIFASSDDPAARLWPKLEITYDGCGVLSPYFTYTISGNTVSFTSNSTDVSSWYWDFGNGDSSVLQNPEYSFSAPGKYQVCLTEFNDCAQPFTGCDTVLVCDVLIDDFGVDASNDRLVSFTNLSEYVTNSLWDFGDGFFTDLTNPVHYYNEYGTYNVCLQQANECDSSEVCKSVLVGPNVISSDNDSGISVFPNPSNHGFKVQIGKPSEHTNCSVVDASGKIIINNLSENAQHSFILPALLPGIYTLIVNTGTFVSQTKLISIP